MMKWFSGRVSIAAGLAATVTIAALLLLPVSFGSFWGSGDREFVLVGLLFYVWLLVLRWYLVGLVRR